MIHAHVSIRERRARSAIAWSCRTARSSAATGSGSRPAPDGRHYKVPQVGIVVVEDDVEIGANTTIDRASVGETRIGAGSKIDNLVQIGHNVAHRPRRAAGRAGRHLGQRDARGPRHAGRPGRRPGPHHDWPRRHRGGAVGRHQLGRAGPFLTGYPAIDNRQWRKASVIFARLPELRQQLITLERRLAALEAADWRGRGMRLAPRGLRRTPCHNRNNALFADSADAMPSRLPRGLACLALQLDTLRRPRAAARIQYTTTRLPNGLWLVLHEDHSTPIVHVELQYHVGSKNERAGRTGFAHLFEHLMFQGSRNVAQDQHQSFIASVGGESNATTNEDATVYWETIPAQYLPMALWLEADRMATLKVDEAAFQRERSVVKEERRQKIENPPYGRLAEIVYDAAFTVHPYKHQVIGSMADLEAATHRRRSRLPRDLLRAGERRAGAWPATSTRRKRRSWSSSTSAASRRRRSRCRATSRRSRRRPKERRLTVYEDVPLPAVVVAHHITYDGHPDSLSAAHRVEGALGRPELAHLPVARLREADRARRVRAGTARSSIRTCSSPPRSCKAGQSPDAAAQALIAELDRLRNEPISAHELERTKNQFARDYILGRLTVQDKAGVLAHAAVIHDDLTTADGEFDIFMNTTAADVQRVAKTYFTPENRLVLTILPRAMQADRGGDAMTARLRCIGALTAERWRARWSCAQVRDWPSERPPRPLAAQPVSFPPYEIKSLANGMKVVVVRQNEQPVVSLRLLVRAGAAQDPDGHDRASRRWSRRCSIRARRRKSAKPDCRHHRLHRRRAGHRRRHRSVLRQRHRDEGQPRHRAAICCPTSSGSPAFANEELERQKEQVLQGAQGELRGCRSSSPTSWPSG